MSFAPTTSSVIFIEIQSGAKAKLTRTWILTWRHFRAYFAPTAQQNLVQLLRHQGWHHGSMIYACIDRFGNPTNPLRLIQVNLNHIIGIVKVRPQSRHAKIQQHRNRFVKICEVCLGLQTWLCTEFDFFPLILLRRFEQLSDIRTAVTNLNAEVLTSDDLNMLKKILPTWVLSNGCL